MAAWAQSLTASRFSLAGRIYLPSAPTRLQPESTNWLTYPPASPHRNVYKYGNINPFPIDYAFQPRLRGRLTLGRLSLPRKPWAYGEQVSHLFYRYSCQHNHFCTVQRGLRLHLLPVQNALLPLLRVHSFGAILSSDTFSAQGH